MSVEMIGLILTLVGIIIGSVWWMAALYHRVDLISKQLSRIQSHLVSELGGWADSGESVPGNQNRLRKQVQLELNEKISAISERVARLEAKANSCHDET